MTTFFKEIFTYHNHFNQKLIAEINLHSNKLPERTFPLFCHVLNAHQIWNSRICLFEHVGNSVPFAVRQIHTMDSCGPIDNSNYTETLKILDAVDLQKTILYKNSKGEQFSNTVRDILFHVANHSIHHKGQIISDFRQAGIDPVVTDYIFYKR